ncbi:MAG: ATP-binding protein [Okeania sp. SIO2F4]|uniref:ATP-binding protein n=1 Tax=Okeania sp. SIO2F4 TaxID=2607790 RepID=UPI001429F6BC|nr:ATP-binding protein [Okeania sp. SIO2F4]NES07166.1 ATP-binding protein [Okeania sp. SIO2F4]
MAVRSQSSGVRSQVGEPSDWRRTEFSRFSAQINYYKTCYEQFRIAIHHILNNLLSHAIKYSPNGSNITLEVFGAL